MNKLQPVTPPAGNNNISDFEKQQSNEKLIRL